MADRDIQDLLLYQCLTAPLNPNPLTDLDKAVNKLRLKYRTYRVDMDPDYGAVMLPSTFGSDFGDEIDRFATFVDPNNNEFELLVQRNNGGIFLTKGWHGIRDFYGISMGASFKILFIGLGKFCIKKIKTRFGRKITIPRFVPSMKFVIAKNYLPFSFPNAVPTPFVHDDMNFRYNYEKRMSKCEVDYGFLMLAYHGFCEMALSVQRTALKLVDDNGNMWDCTLIYSTRKYNHFKIGGGFKRMVIARRLAEGVRVKIGAPIAGNNDTVYFTIVRD